MQIIRRPSKGSPPSKGPGPLEGRMFPGWSVINFRSYLMVTHNHTIKNMADVVAFLFQILNERLLNLEATILL